MKKTSTILETKVEKEQIGLGRLGNVLFTYKKGEEDLDLFDNVAVYERKIVDRNTLRNVIELIHPSANEFIDHKKIDEKADFSGDITWSVLLDDEKFRRWHEYEMLIDWEFFTKEGRKFICEACGKEIKSYKDLMVWGGANYHIKGCFTKVINEEFEYDKNRLDVLEYLLKIIKVFDPENEKREEFETKVKLMFIPWHIFQAYYLANNYLWHETQDEYYKKKGKEGIIKDIDIEISRALFKLDDVVNFFYKNKGDLIKKHLKRFEVSFNSMERIDKILKEGCASSGIEIEEIEEYQKIKKQCNLLLKLI